MKSPSVPVIIGAIITVLTQLIIAPNITLFSVTPNFIVVYVFVVAMLRPGAPLYLFAFAMGMINDLVGYGPVGVTPFLLVAAAFIASRVFLVLNNDTIFVLVLSFVFAEITFELCYAAFMVGFGEASSFIDAVMYRAIPIALYSSVLGLIAYPVARYFLVTRAGLEVSTSAARLR